MLPTVAKVIFVGKLALFSQGYLCQSIFAFIYYRFPIFFTWYAVLLTGYIELVQMTICPSHRNLNDFMQIEQRGFARN